MGDRVGAGRAPPKRVAIAGMGGVGGVHLLTLARLGIGAFHSPTWTSSRQPISTARSAPHRATLGQPKVDVMAEHGAGHQPDAEIRRISTRASTTRTSTTSWTASICSSTASTSSCWRSGQGLRALRRTGHPGDHRRTDRDGHGLSGLHAGRDDLRAVFRSGRPAGRAAIRQFPGRPDAARDAPVLSGRSLRAWIWSTSAALPPRWPASSAPASPASRR